MSIGLACLLTVLIETSFFMLFGYRCKSAIIIVILTNVITNLVLNVTLAISFPQWTMGVLLVAEILVVAAEYMIYSIPFGRGWKLFTLTFVANALSCGVGLIIITFS